MIGIDISDKSIKVAEVTEGATPKLRAVGWAALPAEAVVRGVVQDVEFVSNQLKSALQGASPVPAGGKKVVASIPEIQSFVSVVEVPRMSPREMDEAVPWAAAQHLPFDIGRVYLDWQELSAGAGNKAQVLVGAAQRSVVDPLLSVIDGLGLTCLALELEAQSIVRSLLPLSASDIRGVLIVDLGAASTNVIFFDQGAMRFTTSVPQGGDILTTQLAQGLGITPEEAAEKKALVGVSREAQDQTIASPLRSAAKSLVERVRQVVNQGTIQAILLGGGAANLPGISEVFNEVFSGVPVEMGNPWTNLLAAGSEHMAPLSGEDAAHFATALGLALRKPEYE